MAKKPEVTSESAFDLTAATAWLRNRMVGPTSGGTATFLADLMAPDLVALIEEAKTTAIANHKKVRK